MVVVGCLFGVLCDGCVCVVMFFCFYFCVYVLFVGWCVGMCVYCVCIVLKLCYGSVGMLKFDVVWVIWNFVM